MSIAPIAAMTSPLRLVLTLSLLPTIAWADGPEPTPVEPLPPSAPPAPKASVIVEDPPGTAGEVVAEILLGGLGAPAGGVLGVLAGIPLVDEEGSWIPIVITGGLGIALGAAAGINLVGMRTAQSAFGITFLGSAVGTTTGILIGWNLGTDTALIGLGLGGAVLGGVIAFNLARNGKPRTSAKPVAPGTNPVAPRISDAKVTPLAVWTF